MTDNYHVDSLLKEFHQAIQALKIKESESTWQSLDSTFHKLTGCIAALPPTCPSEQLSCIFPVLKELVSPINQFVILDFIDSIYIYDSIDSF